MTSIAKILSAIMLLTPLALMAQKEGDEHPKDPPTVLVVDLADKAKVKRTISPGKYQLQIRNKLPNSSYVLRASTRRASLEAIPTPAFAGKGAVDPTSPCAALLTSIEDLKAEKDEAKVPSHVARIRTDSASSDEKACVAARKDAGDVIARTRSNDEDTYDVKQDYLLSAMVTRVPADGLPERTWERVFTTVDQHWDVSYGYAFASMRETKYWKGQQTYFAKAVPNDTIHYVIMPDNEMDSWQHTAAAFFNYAPDRSGWWQLLPGLGSGLAVDLAKPAVMLGALWTYHTNLHVTIGGAMRQERRLAGQYHPGDTIKSNLTSEQLHTDRWRPRPFVAVSWRFAENPFKSGDKKEAAPVADETKDEPKKDDAKKNDPKKEKPDTLPIHIGLRPRR